MFNLPDTIIVGGVQVPVGTVPHILTDDEHYGHYNARTMEISIESTISQQKKEVIFCHEFMEVVEDVYGLDLKETEKQAIGVAIHQLLSQMLGVPPR